MAQPSNQSAHGAHALQSARPPSHRRPRAAKPRARSRKPLVLTAFVVLLLAGITFGGYQLWQHRPVRVSVNGQQRTVLRLTSVADLYAAEGVQTKPGNLVSVGNNLLEEGKGYPYDLFINGAHVPYDKVCDYSVLGGESLEFTDGADKLEDHTVEVVEVQPKLEFLVGEGVGDKPFQVQQGQVQYVRSWGKTGTRELLHGNQTDETAFGDWVDEGSNLVIAAQNIEPDANEKLVALTFDDGPTYYTRQYLDILADHDVHATFCVIGRQLDEGIEVVKEIQRLGHQVINGTWSHQLLTALDPDSMRREVADTSAKLKELLASDTVYLRPSFGDMDTQTWMASQGLFSVSVGWTQDARDWEQPGTDAIVQNATASMRPGSIILMHDGGGDRTQDLEAIPRILTAWQNAGYRFVTVEELLASDSSISLDAVAAGPMPADAVWPTEVAE